MCSAAHGEGIAIGLITMTLKIVFKYRLNFPVSPTHTYQPQLTPRKWSVSSSSDNPPPIAFSVFPLLNFSNMQATAITNFALNKELDKG